MKYYIFIQPVRKIDGSGDLYGQPGVDRVPADALPENKIEAWLANNMIIEAAVDDPFIPPTELIDNG